MNKIDKVLPFVKRPLRYMNTEWNSYDKGEKDVNVCLCFPDLYELAVSNMGIEILYHIINAREDASCSRCYCPDIDMQECMQAEGAQLAAIEAQKPLRTFDIIGFSLQFELCFTNVLSMLDSAGIPLRSDQRDNEEYLVIAGGPVCSNPEPVSDYFDAFVLGDGEEVIHEIIDTVKEHKTRGSFNKQELLLALTRITGVYVPRFYDVAYNPDGTIAGISRNNDTVPETISRRTIDISRQQHPVKPVVPYLEAVHDRFNVEISRGCRYSCRFCQASNIYHPWRERTPDQIMDIIRDGIAQSGYEEFSLMSFSATSYSKIEELLEMVSEYSYRTNTPFSVPSLRCDKRTAGVLQYLTGPHRAGLTFGVESGSQRMRDFIGKDITDEDIDTTLKAAYDLGWKLVKLYFMYGLPGEQQEDIQAIADLTKKVRRTHQRLRVNVTISPFVPKAHTPFQWVRQENTEGYLPKKKFLMANIRGDVKVHAVEMSMLEGVFARGDRRLGRLIHAAWKKGCRFDNWKEKFSFALWEDACRECGLDPAFYLRQRSYDEILPWDHIDYGMTKETLYKRYETAQNGN